MSPAAPTDELRPSRALPAFVGAVVTIAVGLLVVASVSVRHIDHLPLFFLLFGFALATERIEVNLGPVGFTGGVLPAVAACVMTPGAAPLLGLAALAGDYPSMRSRATNTSVSIISCSAGAAAAASIGAPDSIGTTILAACLATIAYLLANSLLISNYFILVGGGTLREIGPQMAASFVATGIFFSPIVGLFCAAVLATGAWMVPIFLVPLAGTQYFHGLYRRKLQLTGELAEKAQILARTNLQFAAAMVKALDTRDAYTAGHSAAVAVYTRDIAREMGFDDETVRVAHLAGLLHDIGKIGVPGRVLNKTAPLDDEEYELMKSHAAMGAEILGEVDLYSDIAILVRYHHERIDGKGYPDRLEGEAIPAISRMISVADTYSAMTTDRPYRDGMPTEKAMSILRDCRGTQLDADFTDAFLRILIVADEAYQRGKQTEFEVEVAKHQALSEVEAEAIRVAAPAAPKPAAPVVPAVTPDGDVVEIELEREAA